MTRGREAGVTLIEMLIVTMIIGVMIAVSVPMIGSGLDALRLEQACDTMAAFLNGGVNRAERRQVPVEIVIAAGENAAYLRSPDQSYVRKYSPPQSVHIAGDPEAPPRRYLVMPGGAVPGFAVEFITDSKKRRTVELDPLSGAPIVRRPAE